MLHNHNITVYQINSIGEQRRSLLKTFKKILPISTFFLCRDGEAILEISSTLPLAGPGGDLEIRNSTLPLAGPGGDLEIRNSWKKNEMCTCDNMARK